MHGKWFCDEEHADEDPQIQKIIEMKRKIDEAAQNQEGQDDDDEEVEIDL